MPPFRQPSQPGASAATKKAFKLPARAGQGASSSPTASTALKETVTAGPSRPAPGRSNGFQSAAAQIDQEDLEAFIISSEDDDDDDDDDDDFSAALNAAASKRAMETPSERKKQQTAPRLPSLSPMSDDSIPHAVSPVGNNDNDNDTTAPPVIGGATDDIPLLPTNLITRLLHESFNDKTTKTGKDASTLMARYLDVFVREAVARATEVVKERQMVKDATGEGDDDVWLDVKDLEEVAPVWLKSVNWLRIVANLVWRVDLKRSGRTEGDWLDRGVHLVWDKKPLWLGLEERRDM